MCLCANLRPSLCFCLADSFILIFKVWSPFWFNIQISLFPWGMFMPSQFGMILTRFYPQHYSLALSIPPPTPAIQPCTIYPPAIQPCTIYPQLYSLARSTPSTSLAFPSALCSSHMLPWLCLKCTQGLYHVPSLSHASCRYSFVSFFTF